MDEVPLVKITNCREDLLDDRRSDMLWHMLFMLCVALDHVEEFASLTEVSHNVEMVFVFEDFF